MEKVTLEQLELLLEQVGLMLTDHSWHKTSRKPILLKATVTSTSSLCSDKPTFHKGASYEDLSGSGHTPDAVANDIFQKMKNEKILFGSYNNYTHALEWNEKKGQFEKRALNEQELMETNCIL